MNPRGTSTEVTSGSFKLSLLPSLCASPIFQQILKQWQNCRYLLWELGSPSPREFGVLPLRGQPAETSPTTALLPLSASHALGIEYTLLDRREATTSFRR